MITVTTRTTVRCWKSNPNRLSVKELAVALNRSPKYVYLMRRAGFKMMWDHASHCYVATPPAARRFITRTNFKTD